MIYLKNNSETQELYIPKNGDYQGKRTYKEGFEEGIEYQKSKLSSIEIKENGLYQNEDGYNEVLVDVLCADNADIRTLYAFDNGEFTPNYNHILFDGTAYMTRTYNFYRDGNFTLIFKIPSGVGNSTILSNRNGLIHIKHEDSNINIKVGDKTGSIAIERDKWHTLEIVGFDTYLLDNEPIPTQGETNLDVDNISSCYLGSFYDYENRTYTDRFQGCINLAIFNYGNYIYYLIPNQDNNFTQVNYSTNTERWGKTNINPSEGVFTFVEESAENVLWNKALVRYFPNLTTATFDIEGYDFTNSFSTPEGYEGMNRVTINNPKQASKIMNDGNNISLNTIIDPNIFEITENGFYTPNMEVIPAVWFMDLYTTYGWDITDIQQERIEVRFLVTPEMIKDRSCWVFGKSDENYFSDDPQIFGLEITGDDWGAKAKYYQNGLKQEIDINYHTWIDFITYPHPDNADVRVIECFEQYFEVENSALSTDGNRITKCVIGGLGANRFGAAIKNNTAYLGMLSSIKVSTDNYYKETTISGGDGSFGIGFEGEWGIILSNKLPLYEFYKNGGFASVNVNVPQEGGSCNLQERWLQYNSTDELNEGIFVDVLPEEGYDGMSRVVANISPIIEQGKTEGKESVINSLQTLNVTENGTYTPPLRSFLRLDGDDKYDMFEPSDVNAFEIKFKVNSNGDTEFFSQNDNDIAFIGLRAYPSLSILQVNWFSKQISISGVDFSKWHTLVMKMLDENARVILDGQVYNDYVEFSAYENNEANVSIYGIIDLEHFTFWNTWEDYNNGDIPYFDFKVTSEGLMRNYNGGEYEVVENIGGDSAQYIEGKDYEGWNEVVVNVQQEGESGITSSIVETTYSTLALRTENVNDNDIIIDRTQLVGSGDNYTENGFISYTQNKNGIIICGSSKIGSKYVTKIRKGALSWNTIEYFYSYTIVNFGVDMTRNESSNVMEIHIKYNGGVGTGIDSDIYFRTGCFATSNRLNKIVFYEPYFIDVEDNAFEGVDTSGQVIVVGTDTSENRTKYDALMTQLGDGWTLRFVDEYNE